MLLYITKTHKRQIMLPYIFPGTSTPPSSPLQEPPKIESKADNLCYTILGFKVLLKLSARGDFFSQNKITQKEKKREREWEKK